MVEPVQSVRYVNHLLKSDIYAELNITVFWALTPCCLNDRLARLYNIASQKTVPSEPRVLN
jgi:hypothetical protein